MYYSKVTLTLSTQIHRAHDAHITTAICTDQLAGLNASPRDQTISAIDLMRQLHVMRHFDAAPTNALRGS
jgi:hypothetical protein